MAENMREISGLNFTCLVLSMRCPSALVGIYCGAIIRNSHLYYTNNRWILFLEITMTKNINLKPVAAVVGAALVGSLSAVSVANATDNPFGSSQMPSGYMQLASSHEGVEKAKEGSCGGDKEMKEGSCGGDKKMKEGKCGEGKCGGDKK